ncbi:MAG: hypothetical protein AAF962_27515 [Actinomycetota bacterium]
MAVFPGVKRRVLAAAALAVLPIAAGCSSPSDVASENLSEAADNFEIERRIVFFNGITDSYLLEIEGRCSISADGLDNQLEVTCRTAEDEFKKHFLGLSDNVTYFVEQIEGADVSTYNYRVRYRPETIIPDIELDIEDDSEPAAAEQEDG